jgi:hypothetical protein
LEIQATGTSDFMMTVAAAKARGDRIIPKICNIRKAPTVDGG